MVPSAPGSSQETWGLQPPLPTKISGPLPSLFLFCLWRSRPAQACLLALSHWDRILSRGHERAGECSGLVGGPRYSTLALCSSLQPGFSPPTLGCHFSEFCPDIAIFVREALNQ